MPVYLTNTVGTAYKREYNYLPPYGFSSGSRLNPA
jgi:hypothetical protein